MIRPLLVCCLLAAGPALAQPALAQPTSALPAEPDKACVSDRPARCPILLSAEETSVPAQEFGTARLRDWRPNLGPDRRLYVYLGRTDQAGGMRFAPQPVPILRGCLDALATPGVEVRYVRPGGLIPPQEAGTTDPESWFVALRIPDALDGAPTAIAISLTHVRMNLWPEAGAGVVKGKIRSRRERMHAGVN